MLLSDLFLSLSILAGLLDSVTYEQLERFIQLTTNLRNDILSAQPCNHDPTIPQYNSLTINDFSLPMILSGSGNMIRLVASMTRTFWPGTTLTELEFAGIDFDEDRDGDDAVLLQMMKCLRSRSNAQAEVERLILRDCFRLTHDNVSELEEIVEDVDWDNQELGFTDSEEGIDNDEMYDLDFEDDFYYFW
ncbi:hypothetical protein K435DRAFT_64034 [Dendrothele bispora CBS 962.96]|uniref:F-box domain-containing protein n=1 Tax=Dendrothele bispora (strain CBS 962.96) TaxID=1314807 RepID=A0A4S8KRA8_DENBC|nr:hypothetical protein K435DRAFT_64034 [Dendrothele bispora CBS 962.96]